MRITLADLENRATITIEEAGRLIGIRRSTAYNAASRGELPTRRVGRRLLVPVPAFLAWLGDTSAEDDGGDAALVPPVIEPVDAWLPPGAR
ncbi:MAG: helix-turn-helix domain-containing protein [Acidimicrobiales bacterium]